METFDTLQSQYDAALPAYYDDSGPDASPDYCALCEELWQPFDEIVETIWGLMHEACATSEEGPCEDLP